MRCRRCGNVNTPDSQFCICCGMPQIPSGKSAKDPVDNLIVTLGIVVIFLLIAVIGTTIYKNIGILGKGEDKAPYVVETETDVSDQEAVDSWGKKKTEDPQKPAKTTTKTKKNEKKPADKPAEQKPAESSGREVIIPIIVDRDTQPEDIVVPADKPAQKPAEQKPAEQKPADSKNGTDGDGDANLD